MKKFFDDVSIKTIIGEKTFVDGDIEVSGVVRIDGDVDGNVSSNSCLMIGEKARIRGNIRADSIVSRGLIEGDILAENEVRLFSSAVVIGDVFTKKVNIQEGVLFEGRCFAINDIKLFEAKKEEYLKKINFSKNHEFNANKTINYEEKLK